jgi:hypothetical protein
MITATQIKDKIQENQQIVSDMPDSGMQDRRRMETVSSRDGLLQISHTLIPMPGDRIHRNTERLPQETFGKCVYVLNNPATGLIKIGISNRPQSRVINLQLSSGSVFDRMFVSLPIFNPLLVERAMHQMFAKERGVGEWFRASFDEAALLLLQIESLRDEDEIVPQGPQFDNFCRMRLNVIRRNNVRIEDTP